MPLASKKKSQQTREGRKEGEATTYKYNDSVIGGSPKPPKTATKRRKSAPKATEKNFVLTPSGYIQSWERVPHLAWAYVQGELDKHRLNAEDRRLFKHVLNSGSCWANSEAEIGWVPVAWRLIDRSIPGANPNRLIEAGLVESDGIYIPGVKSYRYRVSLPIREEYARLTLESLQAEECVWVNLFGENGSTTAKREKSVRHDENRNPQPKLIRESMDIIKMGYFTRTAAFEHVFQLRDTATKIKAEHGEDSAVYKHAFGRYMNDLTALKTLEKQKIERVYGQVWSYHMAFESTTTGRSSQIGIGAQSCTREMKEAVYKDVRGVHNYDIRSSQVVILRDELERAQFNTDWLDEYLSTDRAKYVYAERAGVSVDTWKRILMAVIMGSGLRWHTQKGYENAVRDYIEAEAGERAEDVFKRVRGALTPLYVVIREWHEYLIGFWLLTNSYRAKDGKRYVKNDTGKSFCIDDVENVDELGRKLAAFILQGREAAFIYSLTLLSRTGQYGFEVIANEHDGLVTLGAIPEEAIDVVRQARSMQFVDVVEKAFV